MLEQLQKSGLGGMPRGGLPGGLGGLPGGMPRLPGLGGGFPGLPGMGKKK
jgi:signal recognition particle subunit SRP54